MLDRNVIYVSEKDTEESGNSLWYVWTVGRDGDWLQTERFGIRTPGGGRFAASIQTDPPDPPSLQCCR